MLGGVFARADGDAEQELLAGLTASAVSGVGREVLSGGSGGAVALGVAVSRIMSEAGLREATVPLRLVLDVVGGEGLGVTAGGGLPRVADVGIAGGAGTGESWVGALGDVRPPVAFHYAAARRLGLIRRNDRRLVLTRAGLALRDDPGGLWGRAAGRLPVGSPAQRDAGMLLLLVAAADGSMRDYICVASSVLPVVAQRWPAAGIDAVAVAEPTYGVLAAVGGFAPGAMGGFTPYGRALAAAALHRPSA